MLNIQDYLDAFERLMKLKVPGEQQREYIRVLMECSLKVPAIALDIIALPLLMHPCAWLTCQERVYNPFYAALAEKLCEYSHSHRVTFQV